MDQNPSNLLQEFSSKERSPRETIPLIVKGYILPQDGSAENAENARVMAVRWDTGERVEIALRDVEGSRPSIGQFKHDDSATPVTTEINGTIVADGAYLDRRLQPLSGHNVPVYNARWLNRIAPEKNAGWGLVSTARVNDPRLINPNDPSRGYTQTVSVMNEELAEEITSIQQLDDTMVAVLDAAARDQGEHWFKRPGAVNAFVRLSYGDNSTMVELSGGFYQPPEGEYKVPKTRDMVAQDLGQSTFWQSRREKITQALSTPGYKVEVIPGSTLFVGKKTLQKSMAAGRGPVNGSSFEDGSSRQNLFSRLTLGIRRSPKTGQPQILFAQPHVPYQVASLTGLPNPEEADRYKDRSVLPSAQSNALNAPQASTRQAPAQPANNSAPSQARALPAQAISVRKTEQPRFLKATASTDQEVALLQSLSNHLNIPYDAVEQSVTIPDDKLPVLMSRAKISKLKVTIEQNSAQPAPQAAIEHQAPRQAAPTTQQSPSQRPDQQSNPTSTPRNSGATGDNVDLSQLDLSSLDLDGALEQVYADQQQKPTGPQR